MSTITISLLWGIIIAVGIVGIIFVIRIKNNIFSFDDGLGLLFLVPLVAAVVFGMFSIATTISLDQTVAELNSIGIEAMHPYVSQIDRETGKASVTGVDYYRMKRQKAHPFRGGMNALFFSNIFAKFKLFLSF